MTSLCADAHSSDELGHGHDDRCVPLDVTCRRAVRTKPLPEDIRFIFLSAYKPLSVYPGLSRPDLPYKIQVIQALLLVEVDGY